MAKNHDRVRTTISVEREVHQVFVQMAEAGGMSVSRCMGEWLADTVDGAQFVASKMQEAKRAPITVMRELQAMSVGAADLAQTVIDDFRAHKRVRAKSAPSSNTGLNTPDKRKK